MAVAQQPGVLWCAHDTPSYVLAHLFVGVPHRSPKHVWLMRWYLAVTVQHNACISVQMCLLHKVCDVQQRCTNQVPANAPAKNLQEKLM